ncbi:hypothetical protein NP233_g12443 [Leucocoprinus birnbaumii]|uniref:Uncharacterized protein n=1 Tax=Leucocoprinus birnbaumii TaxID=56174 RepID=A0AAD5VEL3_9AGAR|nr:hypothetical protein NP233_g12443 [Leucocoprinus birnbaumii]
MTAMNDEHDRARYDDNAWITRDNRAEPVATNSMQSSMHADRIRTANSRALLHLVRPTECASSDAGLGREEGADLAHDERRAYGYHDRARISEDNRAEPDGDSLNPVFSARGQSPTSHSPSPILCPAKSPSRQRLYA